MIVFVYLFSTSIWLVDEMILKSTSFKPEGLENQSLNPEELRDGTGDAEHNFSELAEKAIDIEQDGTILDRIGQFAETGYNSVWLVLELLSGSYLFFVLYHIGMPHAFIIVLQLLFPFFVVSQVIWYVAGRY